MKNIFLLAAAAIALTACNSEEGNYEEEPIAAQITATIGEAGVTRASDESWAKGDTIGITMRSDNGNMRSDNGNWYENVKYSTADGDGNFAGTTMYFRNKGEPVTLTAYYPFAGVEGKAPGKAGVITASTDATCQTAAEQPKIDFLYAEKKGVTGSDPNVAFEFSHKMSKLTLTFKNGDGMNVSNITSYEIAGLGVDGSFDTSTGVCTPNGESKTLTIEDPSVIADTPLPSLILFPQSTADKTVTLKITVDQDQDYKCELKFKDNEISAGNNYKFTVSVGKIGLTISNATITNWILVEDPNIVNAI